jgi:hypothetical protein
LVLKGLLPDDNRTQPPLGEDTALQVRGTGRSSMNPLQRILTQLPGIDDFIANQRAAGVSVHLARQRYTEHHRAQVWGNDVYLVTVHRNYRGEMNASGPARTMISVRRIDGRPFGDWADLQIIKNQLLGPEAELVQLFPAESRKVDMVNNYWFYDNAGQQFKFGAKKREVNNAA